MAQLLNFPSRFVAGGRLSVPESPPSRGSSSVPLPWSKIGSSEWAALQKKVSGGGRVSCFFTDGRKQDQARKALEGALGEKKTEFEKWNKEIEKRKSSGGGGDSGRGGWFGGGGSGGWFGWSNDEHFWDESKQAGITLGAIFSLFLLLTKGGVIFAVVFNSLLFVLRGIRTRAELVVSFFSRKILGTSSPAPSAATASSSRVPTQPSAKERVVSKWATD